MNVTYSFFADAVSLDINGKVNALGIFDNLFAQQFPAVHPKMYHVVKIQYHRIEYGDHVVKISFVDPDGSNVCPDMTLNVTVNEGNGSSTHIVEYTQIQLNKPGPHAVDISVNGRHLTSTTLSVVKVEETQQ